MRSLNHVEVLIPIKASFNSALKKHKKKKGKSKSKEKATIKHDRHSTTKKSRMIMEYASIHRNLEIGIR